MQNSVYDDEKTKNGPDGVHDDLGVSAADKKAEIADLENSYNSPSKRDSPSETDESSKVQGLAKDLYKPSSVAKKAASISGFKIDKKKGGIFGGIVGLIVALFIGSMSLGPLQFVHFAQMLQGFHFADQENASNHRIKRLLVYAKTNDASKTRLGIIANIQANKIDKKLAQNGWEIKSKGSGTFDGFEFDPKKIDSKLSQAEIDKQNQKVKADLEKQGVKNVTIKDGVVRVPPENMKYWANKKLIGTMYSNGRDVGKITSAYEKRLLIKRAGITWNPITKIDTKIRDAAIKKFQEERSKRLTGKLPPEVNATSTAADENATDEEKKQAAKDADAANGGNELANEAKNGKLKSGALKGAGGIGFLCIVKTVADEASGASKINRYIPLMQAGAEVVGVGNKAMAGDDVNLEALGVINESMNNAKDGSTFASANSILYEQGKTSGTTLPANVGPDGGQNVASELLGQVPGLGAICKVLNNSIVSIVLGAGNIATTLAMEAFFRSPAGEILFNKLIGFFTTDPVDLSQPQYAGGVYGESANVGARILANETSSAMGGRPLSSSEELALKDYVNNEKSLDDKSRSIADRYLNPKKYDSFAGKAVGTIKFTNLARTVAISPNNFVYAFSSKFTKPVSAADNITPEQAYYGIKKVGFTSASLDRIENPYQNAEEARAIILRTGDKYKNLLKTCNKIDVSVSDTTNLDFTSEAGTADAPAVMTEYPPECSDDSDEFLKVRVAALDTVTMKSFSCLEFNDEESCNDISGTSSTETTPTDTLGTVNAEGWTWPLAKPITINSCFAQVLSKGPHPGLDLDAVNKPVYAAAAGTVYNDPGGSYGIIIIKHSDSLYSVYEHMQSFTVAKGATVAAGQQIGISGEVGAPGAPHLHFGITTDPAVYAYEQMGQGKIINPLLYVNNGEDYAQCSASPRIS